MKANLWSEFLEFVGHAIDTTKKDTGIEIKFTLSTAEKRDAYVSRLSLPNEFEIAITEMMRDEIYEEAVTGNVLSDAISFIKQKYRCSDSDIHLQNAICFTTWALLFCHERGHIIQGHALLLPLNAALSLKEESLSILQAVPGLPIVYDNNLRNMMEYDADSFAGLSAAPSPQFMEFECPTDQERIMVGMCIISIAAYYFMTYLSRWSNDSTPLYPPLSIRVTTLSTSFLHSYNYFINNGKLLLVDHKPDITLLKGENYREAINITVKSLGRIGYPSIDFSRDKIQHWLEVYKANMHRLVPIHDLMRRTFPSKTDPALVPTS